MHKSYPGRSESPRRFGQWRPRILDPEPCKPASLQYLSQPGSRTEKASKMSKQKVRPYFVAVAVEVVLVPGVTDTLPWHFADRHEFFGAVALDDLRFADVQCVTLCAIMARIALEDPRQAGGTKLRDGQKGA